LNVTVGHFGVRILEHVSDVHDTVNETGHLVGLFMERYLRRSRDRYLLFVSVDQLLYHLLEVLDRRLNPIHLPAKDRVLQRRFDTTGGQIYDLVGFAFRFDLLLHGLSRRRRYNVPLNVVVVAKERRTRRIRLRVLLLGLSCPLFVHLPIVSEKRLTLRIKNLTRNG
jgi:hypothetical protein